MRWKTRSNDENNGHFRIGSCNGRRLGKTAAVGARFFNAANTGPCGAKQDQMMKTTAIAGWGHNGRQLGRPLRSEARFFDAANAGPCGEKQDQMMKTTAITGWGRSGRLLGKV
ncbi:hypothetical protein CEXT_428701 [Caerostris extrusa]|uniref:Uncharacterized protein n=1 Tax=Caerostris extrusa TaxID=172846 RepID=A0AAV4N1X2_CAEEX|nr:hypothetical protein CEXT_428701 [Caerostris extrusa]